MQDIGEALQKAMDYCPVPFVVFCPAHPFSSKKINPKADP
jgi:hypothetical protein